MKTGGGQAPANHEMMALAWLSGGAVMAVTFSTGQLPPLQLTIILLAILTVVAIASLRITELSIMSRLYVLLFSMPFSATLGYLVDREFVWWNTPTNVLLCQNHGLINEMLTMVTVGLCGMMFGIEFMAIFSRKQFRAPAPSSDPPPARAALTLPVVWFLLFISFMCSWLHAPEETIYTAAYASADAGGGMDKEAGLNASYLISYLILTLLIIDSEQERPGSRRQRLKLFASFSVLAYIVVIFQLLRGDRECAGLLAALVMLYITNPRMGAARTRLAQGFQQFRRAAKLAVPLTFCVMVFLALGSLRHSASQASQEQSRIWDMVIDGATQNTWTAVALNNLGLAADYNYGTIEYMYGQTYLDYILSLPPGAITKALGYERPLEGEANPASWYFGLIAAGGMHPVVVPFRNLGIWGVLGVMALFGTFICYCEAMNERGTLFARLLYGCVCTSSMLWFWYGDMNMIRTVMAWAILSMLHQFAAVAPQRSYLRNAPRPQSQPQMQPGRSVAVLS